MLKLTLRKHPLAAYFTLAYLITWGIALPLVAQTRGWSGTRIAFSIHYLTAFGPLLSALIVVAVSKGGDGVRDYLKTWFAVRGVRLWVWLVALAPFPLFLAVAGGLALAGRAAPDLSKLGVVNFLPDLGPVGALLLWTLTSGLGEEAGWRGFALPCLQEERTAFSSSVIIAVFWAGWHTMAFFYVPTYMKLSIRVLPGFLIGILSGSILLTWLYNNSAASLFPSIVWHGVFNFVTAANVSNGIPAAAVSTIVIVGAVIIAVLLRPEDLVTRRRKGQSKAAHP